MNSTKDLQSDRELMSSSNQGTTWTEEKPSTSVQCWLKGIRAGSKGLSDQAAPPASEQ